MALPVFSQSRAVANYEMNLFLGYNFLILCMSFPGNWCISMQRGICRPPCLRAWRDSFGNVMQRCSALLLP